MYHSIVYGDKNTWDDWHIVPASRPVFLPPDVKTNYVDIPGADGHIDLSEALSGEPLYKNRSGSTTFYVMNGYKPWEHIYSEIMNYLHGQKMQVYLEDDPFYYYEGRFSVNTWRSEKSRSEIVIDYNVAPYKLYRFSSAEKWLWDPFDFLSGIVREYDNLTVDGTYVLTVVGGRKSVIPNFIVTLENTDNPILLTWPKNPDVVFSLYNGTNKLPDLKILDEIVELTFKGKGTVSVDYRGGSL